MPEGMAAKIAEADVDPNAQQRSPVARFRGWRDRRAPAILAAVGAIAYLVALIATLPATMILNENDRFQVGGTIWNGEAVIDSTVRVDWGFAPLLSLANLAFTSSFQLDGGSSDLTGHYAQRGDQLRFENVTGQVDGVFLDAMFPKLPMSCDFIADLDLDHVHVRGDGQVASGSTRTGPMSCSAKELAALPVALPPLEGALEPSGNGTNGYLQTADGRVRMIELRLSPEGSLSVWPTQMATNRVPFLRGQRYDTRLE